MVEEINDTEERKQTGAMGEEEDIGEESDDNDEGSFHCRMDPEVTLHGRPVPEDEVIAQLPHASQAHLQSQQAATSGAGGVHPKPSTASPAHPQLVPPPHPQSGSSTHLQFGPPPHQQSGPSAHPQSGPPPHPQLQLSSQLPFTLPPLQRLPPPRGLDPRRKHARNDEGPMGNFASAAVPLPTGFGAASPRSQQARSHEVRKWIVCRGRIFS